MYDDALDNYNQAITKAPTNVEFLKNRAATYYDLKNYDESAKDLDRALKQNENDA